MPGTAQASPEPQVRQGWQKTFYPPCHLTPTHHLLAHPFLKSVPSLECGVTPVASAPFPEAVPTPECEGSLTLQQELFKEHGRVPQQLQCPPGGVSWPQPGLHHPVLCTGRPRSALLCSYLPAGLKAAAPGTQQDFPVGPELLWVPWARGWLCYWCQV